MSRIFIFIAFAIIAICTKGYAEDRSLPLHHLHQEKSLCVPTSASIVLDFYGKPHSPREIKAWSRGREYDPKATFDDFTGTPLNSLIKGLKAHGIQWSKIVFENDANGLQNGIKELKRQIDLGRPVLIDTSSLYKVGHTLVISGYKESGAVFIAVDPFLQVPGLRELPLKTLESVWNSIAVGANNRAAVITE